jgi:phage terminase large subunit GpA-like protein
MDAVSDPNVEVVVGMFSAQTGKTETINNAVGFHIDQDPAPILLLQPTLEMAEAWSKDRLAPMLRDSPCLAGKVNDPRSRDSGNTVRHKVFPGGHITMAGANSPASLASRPIRIVLADEIDRFPSSAGSEGDPVSLAKKRSKTFWNRKVVLTSTPTIAGHSRIEEAYEESDQRRYFVPCPDCGESQDLKWERVKWTGEDPSTALYACVACGSLWNDQRRQAAVAKGEWRAAKAFNGIAGFHIWQAYSPWVKLSEIVAEFLASRANPERLKVFVNTELAETWKEKGEAPEWKRLYDRAESYKIGIAPKGVVFITLGIDVQADRLEVYVWGWGRGLESWLIDHRVLSGDPYAANVWNELTDVIGDTWPHELGARLTPVKVAIDSGYATTEVYKWAKLKPGLVIAVKGVEHGSAGVGIPQAVDAGQMRGEKKKRRGAAVWPVVSGIYKAEMYGFLRLEAPTRESGEDFPPGYVHLPKFSDEVFKQLTAEQLVTRTVKFRRKTEWEKTRDRNEALDCRVYARAAASVYGMDRFNEHNWDQLEKHLAIEKKKPIPAKGGESEHAAQAEGQRPAGWIGPRSGGWLKR